VKATSGTDRAAWMTVRDVAKQYGGEFALQPTSLDVRANTLYGVIGPNGAGKSTLVKVLAGFVPPDGGQIAVDGQVIDLASPGNAARHRVAMMPQELTLVPSFTVAECVTLGHEPTRGGLWSRSRSVQDSGAALAVVGLDINPRTPVAALSPVTKRLVMLAAAVGRDARLLVLDEPTAGLPRAEAELVMSTVERLREHSMTIFYVSHHLSEVAAISTEVLCLREGRLAGHLTSGPITKDALVSLLLGDTAPPFAAATGAVSGRSGPAAASVPPGAAEPSIELKAVSGARIHELDLVARRGEVTGITGLLGSGVEDVVAIVTGAARPRSGTVRLDGEAVSHRSPADALTHGVGAVSGDRSRSAINSMRIRENVSLSALGHWCGRLGLIRGRTERSRVRDQLDRFGVHADAERAFSTLSGGNQQRALTARLVAADLRVLVLDEPTVGVDIASRAQLWEQVRKLREGRVVLVASSEPEELIALCDRVVCLHDGRVSQVLVGSEITEHALLRAVS
jgi:ABC-type sugar transport system ATPase subunit